MGVAGSGKTTIGKKLAEKLHAVFYDGDDFHPEGNIEKMKQGIPLSDEDRSAWLNNLNELLQRESKKQNNIVLACSALKSSYRQALSRDLGTSLIYLKLDIDTAMKRLKGRKNHFFSASLIESQFQILEEDEEAITIDAKEPVSLVLEKISREIYHEKSGEKN